MSRILIPAITTDPIPAKTYDAQWITSVQIFMPTPFDQGSIVQCWKPMAPDGQLLDEERRVVCRNLQQALTDLPSLVAVRNAILANTVAFQEYVATQAAQSSEPPLD
jgi:hypothetical protein